MAQVETARQPNRRKKLAGRRPEEPERGAKGFNTRDVTGGDEKEAGGTRAPARARKSSDRRHGNHETVPENVRRIEAEATKFQAKTDNAWGTEEVRQRKVTGVTRLTTTNSRT